MTHRKPDNVHTLPSKWVISQNDLQRRKRSVNFRTEAQIDVIYDLKTQRYNSFLLTKLFPSEMLISLAGQ